MARKPGITRNPTKRDTTRRKSPSPKPTAARVSGRNAAQQNGTSDDKVTTLTSAQKRKPRTSQKQASSQLRQSAAQRRQAEPAKIGISAPEQRSGRGSKIAAMLGSPVVRNVVAAGLVSAAAALIYRKPKAIAAANESVQEAATELLDGAVGAARATTKAVRKVRRKAVAAVEGATTLASATKDASTARPASGSSPDGTPDTEVAGTTAIQQRTRKRRSDAGMKRGSKTTTLVAEAPISSPPEPSPPPASLSKMETSTFAFGAQPPQPSAEAIPTPNTVEEQLAEAHPS